MPIGRWRITGSLMAIASLPIHLLVDHDVSILIAAMTVAIIGAIYIGFAIADGRKNIIGVESAAATLFFFAALAAIYWSPWIAVAAFVAHGFWDFAHDHGVDTKMPRWYIPLCAFYDWVFAIGLGLIWYLER